MVEVEVASDTDDLSADVTAAVVLAVVFAGVVFDYDDIVCVAVDVLVIAGYVVLFVVVTVDDAGVPTASMLMHDVYAIIFELMIWRVLFI